MRKTFKNERGITLIALVITILVLLILAGVSIAMLTGDNGILTQATEAKEKQADGTVVEASLLLWNEYQVEKNTGVNNSDFLEYLENTKGCIDSNGIINVKKFTGNEIARGNGTKGTEDVYKIIEDSNKYILQYYDKEGSLAEENLWSASKPSMNSNIKTIIIKNEYSYEGLTDKTIQYEEGMTWEQFINSKYNSDKSIKANEDYVVLTQNTQCLISSDSEIDEEGRNELISDIIDSSRNYFYIIPQ